MKLEIKTSSVDKAIDLVYDQLRAEYGEHLVFEVKLESVTLTTNCLEVHVYNFDVEEKV